MKEFEEMGVTGDLDQLWPRIKQLKKLWGDQAQAQDCIP